MSDKTKNDKDISLLNDMLTPLISVILPAFNVQNSIKNILNQLLVQSYSNIEILCVNDGSTDKTEEVIESFSDSRIHLFNKTNGGVSSARNVGLAYAKGDYIAFVDPGDKVDSNYISYLYNLLISTCSQLSICSYDFESSDGIILDRSKQYEVVDCNTFFDKQNAIKELIKNYSKFCGHVWDKMFIRDLIGDLRFDESIHNCEDTLFVFKYLQKCKKVILGPEIHYWYIQDNTSVTHGKYSDKYFTSLIAWQKILSELKDPEDRETLNKKISTDILSHETLALKTLTSKERKKYKKSFLKLMERFRSFGKAKYKIKWAILRFIWKFT